MQLASALGPFEFVPRDFKKMPRNSTTTTKPDPTKLRGVTIHYTGGGMAGYYRGKPLAQADEEMVARTIRNHCARRPPISDVGYNLIVGRSGICWEGRGLHTRNAANGALPSHALKDYPKGTTSSNPFWQSVMLLVGTDAGYTEPTDEQWETARRVVAFVAELFGLDNCQVNGHRDVRATACPGAPIYARLRELVPGTIVTPTPPAPTTPAPDCQCIAAVHKAATFVLKKGDGPAGERGDAVYWLQTGLNQQLTDRRPIATDRKFGAIETDPAVRELQRRNRLKVDGIVGPVTWPHVFPGIL